MNVSVTVYETPRYEGQKKLVTVVEVARVPVKGDYLWIAPLGKVLVDYVILGDHGGVEVYINKDCR